jgi:shikimate dehydrogenase
MMKTIPLAGVLGHPIAHSKSPRLHGFWLKRMGIDGHYIPMDVTPNDLAAAFQTLPKLGFQGVNITIPHKEAALALADIVTERAAKIGAANTITFLPDGQIHADNTDGIGFIANLRDHAPSWRADRGPAAILGAGGAARAIIWALLDAGVTELRITNRTRARADALSVEFGPNLRVFDWDHAAQMLDGAMTVVNTTSLGMAGQGDFPFGFGALDARATVTDIVYNPLKTLFLSQAEAHGCTIVDGLGMLLHQAAPGFARWFGQMPQVDQDTRDVVLGI